MTKKIPEVCKCCGSELTANVMTYLATKKFGRKAFTVRMLMRYVNLPHTHIGQACLALENKGLLVGRLATMPDKDGRGKTTRVYMRVK